MNTETRLARLQECIATLEQYPERHEGELERLYALRAVYQQALVTAPAAPAALPAPTMLMPAVLRSAPAAA